MDAVVHGVHTNLAVSLPGVVVSYDKDTRTANIQPAVDRLLPLADDPDTDVPEKLPVLQGVPVCWPCGTNFAILGELSAGDPVLLVCQDRDISAWRDTGKRSVPGDNSMHSWASAVAIPGLRADAGVLPTIPGDAAALASVVLQELQELRTAINQLAASYNLHAHAALGAPPSTLLTPVPYVTSTPAEVASAILKLGG